MAKLEYNRDEVTGYTLPKRGYKPKFIVIHNDAGSSSAMQYHNSLVNAPLSRLENGIAHSYISGNKVWQALPEGRVAWHTGENTGNTNGYGIEVCQSMSANDKDFLANEQSAFKEAARLLKKWGLPVNRNTVRLHNEFVPTQCPHRSMKLHAGYTSSQRAPQDVVNKTKDYFISQIKNYYEGKKVSSTQIPEIDPTIKSLTEAVAYINKLEGKGWDFDGVYGWQCFDLVNYYWKYVTNHSLAGASAKDIPTKNDFKGYATIYKEPKVGDVAVFNADYGYGHGHTSIVTKVDKSGFESLDQNWYDGGSEKKEVAQRVYHKHDDNIVFIRPHYEDKVPEQEKVIKPKGTATTKGELKVGSIPPKDISNSKNAYFRAKADSAGVSICKLKDGKYYPTNEVYQPGYSQFYIFEIKDGWARVYSNTNNGWVWYERLRIEEMYNTPKKKASNAKLKVGSVPPKTYKKQNSAIFQAKADSAGVTITDRKGNLTNEKYKQGQIFYVFEIVNGYCRVYSPTNNGYVWHERLRITKVY